MGGALRERKVQSTTQSRDCMWVSASNRCAKGRRRDGDCTHTNTHRGTHVFSPFCRPSCLHHCRNSANQLRCSEPTCQHLSLPTHTLQHCSTKVPNTYVYLVHQTHTYTRATLCIVRQAVFFLSNTTAAWPKDCKMEMHIPSLPISPISSSRFTRIGSEMTYSNTCDPARPSAESQRSITSQILLPRKGRVKKKKKSTQAADQSFAALPLLTRCAQHCMSASRSWDRCGLVGRAWREQAAGIA